MPNRISLTGHTDSTPYVGGSGRTNWDLSAERANAARSALEAAGLKTEKVSRVVGLSSSVLFDKNNPVNAINRRISIIVLTKQAEENAAKTEAPASVASAPAGAAPPTAAAAPAPIAVNKPAGPASAEDIRRTLTEAGY